MCWIASALRIIAVYAVAALVVGLLGGPAKADSAPVDPDDPKTPVTVTADSLPTAQHDGVGWQAAVLGQTVYVVGQFRNARPYGAAPGSQLVARHNILAFDLVTGALKPDFAPALNAQAFAIAASPDGTRLYIGGEFTRVNGIQRNRVAALDPSTGSLIDGFAPKANASVRAIAATDDTVWIGGVFTSIGSVSRERLAAVSAGNGTLLPWAPKAQNGKVNALVLSPKADRVVVGGNFTSLNGSSRPGYGLGMVDAVTGKNLAIQVNDVVRNAGIDSSILSLSSDGTAFYGTGYIFGGGGTLEGAFASNWSDAKVKWIEDCHGDSYGTYASDTAVYLAGHPHYCQNLGGFPETSPRSWHRAVAFSKAATGKLTKDTQGYPSFTGQPAPSMLNWFPDMDTGTATGQSQGPWNVTGTKSYVVMVGEFKNVNRTPQQGLARFALKEIAPNKQGPRVSGASFVPSLKAAGDGQIRVQWRSNWDRDNSNLTYTVLRNGTAVHNMSRPSTFWQRPGLEYIDSGLAGGAYKYQIQVQDPLGNIVTGDVRSITIPRSRAVPCKPVQGGCVQDFESESIYQSAAGTFVLSGDIRAAYRDLGGPTGILGFPTAAVKCDAKGGCEQKFQSGSILRTPAGAIFHVAGDLAVAYQAAKAAAGVLGYPVSRQTSISGGVQQDFEGGSLYHSAASGTHAVLLDLRSTYWLSGGHAGRLGFPTTELRKGLVRGGQQQDFQRGTLYITPSHGIRSVLGQTRTFYWTNLGQGGELGYPTGDELCGLPNGTCQQNFESGQIVTAGTARHLVAGKISAKWQSLGGLYSYLLAPVGPKVCGLTDGGCKQSFQTGAVFDSPAAGVHATGGAIASFWSAHGAESGSLGYPTTELTCSNNECSQSFQRGRIRWTPSTGAFAG